MKKNVLKVKGAKQLSKNTQRNITGGSSGVEGTPCYSDRNCYPSGAPGQDGSYACVKRRPWDPSGVCVSR